MLAFRSPRGLATEANEEWRLSRSLVTPDHCSSARFASLGPFRRAWLWNNSSTCLRCLALAVLGIDGCSHGETSMMSREPSSRDRMRRAGPRLLASAACMASLFLFYPTDYDQPGGAVALTLRSPGTRELAFKRPLPTASPPSGGRRIRESWPPLAGANEPESRPARVSALLFPRGNQGTSTLRRPRTSIFGVTPRPGAVEAASRPFAGGGRRRRC